MHALDERAFARGFTSDENSDTEISEPLYDEITGFTVVEIDTGDVASALWEFILPKELFFRVVLTGNNLLITSTRIVVGWHISTSYQSFFGSAKY